MSGARPMVIVGEYRVRSVSNVLVLFHNLLWKAKLDWECLERESRCSHYLFFLLRRVSIISGGLMKPLFCIILLYSIFCL